MNAERSPVIARDLLGLTPSGVKGSPYRAGVFRLLGVPTAAFPRLYLAPLLPPVGFQYERRQPDAPRRSFVGDVDAPAGLTKRADAPARGDDRPRSPVRRGRGPVESTVVARFEGEQTAASRAAGRGLADDVTDGQGDGVQSDAAGQDRPSPQRIIERALEGIRVPGGTRERTVFAALAEAQQPEDFPEEPRRIDELHGEVAPRGNPSKDHAESTGFPGIRRPTSARVERDARAQEEEVAHPIAASPAALVAERSRGGETSLSRDAALSPRVHAAMARLRGAMSALTTRHAMATSEEHEETVSAPPAPDPQVSGSAPFPVAAPVVVVWRPTSPTRRVPRAFWTSSTLRSTHLGARR